MSKILDWIKKHIWQTILIVLGLFFLPLLLVHIAYRIPAISPWFASSWNSGELITYIAGFEAFVGTVFLGAIAVYQNNDANQISKNIQNSTENLHKLERQPIFEIYDCDISTNSSKGISRSFQSYCVKFLQRNDFEVNYKRTTPEKYTILSFTIMCKTRHAFRFSLKNFLIQDLDGNSRPVDIPFILISNACQVSCSLSPNLPTKLMFEFQNDFLDSNQGRPANYKISITFFFMNVIHEITAEESVFLFSRGIDQEVELHYYGNNSRFL